LKIDTERTGGAVSVSEKICEIVGYDRFKEICDTFGGTAWNIPVHPPSHLRDAKIKEEFNRLMYVKNEPATMKTYHAVAEKYGVSIRKVQQVVSGEVEN
jgi:hypothetical protein